MTYFIHVLIMIGIYIIATSSLNLISGYTGLISLAHAAFYGIGAYTVALLALNFHTSFLLSLLAAMALAGIVGILVGIPSLRVRDEYFVLTTFGFQIIVYSIFKNWEAVTRGPLGLPGVPPPNIFGIIISGSWGFLLLVGALALLILLFLRRLLTAPFGQILKAIREDEIFSQSLGKNVVKYKVMAFCIGAMIAAVAGGLFAHYITFVDPSSFTIQESIFMLAIVIIGGGGTLKGSVVGATLLVALPELLRFIGVPSAIAANLRQILYGVLLVVFMMLRPQGLLGEFAFRKKGA
jgi:branched-chain amino acid transport system permease protein